jgi:hypothetical protein
VPRSPWWAGCRHRSLDPETRQPDEHPIGVLLL